MSPSFANLSSPRVRAFSLIELLSVVAIIAVLAGMVIPAISQGDAKKFTSAVDDMTTILEQARTSAMAMNTYVWVGLQPGTASGENGITVTAVASRSGEADTDKSNLQVLLPPRLRSRIALENSAAGDPDTAILSTGDLSFVQKWRGEDVSFDPVIQFNPRGEATITQGAHSRWVQFDLVPTKGDKHMAENKATVRLSGVTGQIVVSRQ